MKHGMLTILVTFFLTVLSSVALAETKIGVSDARRAILQSEPGRQGIEQITESLSEQEGVLEEMQEEIADLQEKLRKDTELMSDDEFQELMQEISIRQNQFVQRFQEFQRVRLEQTDRLIQLSTPLYEEAIETLVLKEKYELILPRQGVHYSHELFDVTAKITEHMNDIYRQRIADQ